MPFGFFSVRFKLDTTGQSHTLALDANETAQRRRIQRHVCRAHARCAGERNERSKYLAVCRSDSKRRIVWRRRCPQLRGTRLSQCVKYIRSRPCGYQYKERLSGRCCRSPPGHALRPPPAGLESRVRTLHQFDKVNTRLPITNLAHVGCNLGPPLRGIRQSNSHAPS